MTYTCITHTKACTKRKGFYRKNKQYGGLLRETKLTRGPKSKQLVDKQTTKRRVWNRKLTMLFTYTQCCTKMQTKKWTYKTNANSGTSNIMAHKPFFGNPLPLPSRDFRLFLLNKSNFLFVWALLLPVLSPPEVCLVNNRFAFLIGLSPILSVSGLYSPSFSVSSPFIVTSVDTPSWIRSTLTLSISAQKSCFQH